MLNGKTLAGPMANGAHREHSVPERSPESARYTQQILVPIALARRDRAALLLGLQMATAYRAHLTVLHVLPPSEPSNSLHWLDGIAHLTRTLSRPSEIHSSPNGDDSTEKMRIRILAFLEEVIPTPLRGSVRVCAASRVGDVAHEIARYAEDAAADFVILGSTRSARGFSLWPGVARRVLQLTSRQVVLARPEGGGHPSSSVASVPVAHP